MCRWSKEVYGSAKDLPKDGLAYKAIQTEVQPHICNPEEHMVYCCGPNQEKPENLELASSGTA